MPYLCIQCKNEPNYAGLINDMCESCYQKSPDFLRKRETKLTDDSDKKRRERRRQEEESSANDAATIAMLATVIAAGGM